MEQSPFIETYILRLLAAFDEYGTLSKVGEALDVTQPPISRAMQKLETELGVTLFERTKNKIALNENGKFAAEYAKRIMALQDEMIEKTRERAGLRRTFSVGSVAIQPAVCIERLIVRLYQGASVSYRIADEDELVRELDDGTFRLIVLLHPLDGKKYESKRYFSESLSIMLPKTHPLATRKSLALADLHDETFVVFRSVGFWEQVKREKIPNAKFLKQDDHDAVETLLKTSSMPVFISNRTTAYTVPNDRVAIPLTDPEVNVTFYAVCLKSESSAMRELLSELQEQPQ